MQRFSRLVALDRVARRRSSLQLLLQLVEESPVATVGDDLLWTAGDHPGLLQAEGIEAHRILRGKLPPSAIDNILHGRARMVVVLCVPLVHEEPGRALWL